MYAYIIRGGGVILMASTGIFDLRSIFLARGLCLQAPRVVGGGLVQAVVTPSAPSCPMCDDEEQGEVL